MDENTSQGSADSDDYVVVNGEPKLRVTGNMSDLRDAVNIPDTKKDSAADIDKNNSAESTDVMQLSVIEDLGQPDNCTMFDGVTYLGSATVNAPRSEAEIYRNMAVLNEQSQMVIPVTLCVPNNCDGIARMLDPATGTDIAQYRVHRIMFCARGPTDSKEKQCFAFTCSHGSSYDGVIFQCHVFRCKLPEAVARILYCFATTFRRQLKPPRSASVNSNLDNEQSHMFTVTMEIREDDGRGNYSMCPRDKNVYKLRCNVEKKVVINVQQSGTSDELRIERCFGLLISPGRNVKDGDMQLIEMDSMGQNNDTKGYSISGNWDPTDPSFAVLNAETEKDTRVFFTVAVDLVICGIQEPVRFAIETKAKIYPQSERFWYFTKRPQIEDFHIKIKLIESAEDDSSGEPKYEVVSVRTQSDLERRKTGLNLGLANKPIPEDLHSPQDTAEEVESDGDEPLLSGSGTVSKEVHDENIVEAWRDVLSRWHQQLELRPPQVTKLVRKGIPEALRGEVWPLLARCANDSELLEAYRVLIAKESANEQVILRDIYRTFPAHDFFKESGGAGQDSLYKISKAYSGYDEEIGYCQGLSFLAAALLLHMPEEQAFCVLVKVMFDYELRELFKQDFEELHLKFYQLERLMQDLLPDLFDHFIELNLEAHMFASQWFLTLFTAKFPLQMVYRIVDVYLSESCLLLINCAIEEARLQVFNHCGHTSQGKTVIFSVAMALLKNTKKDLLALDFEGVLKYFRVHLPKKYRSEEMAQELMNTAVTIKVTSKKLKKYEKEYIALKEQDVDPVERLENENKRLMEDSLRLEQENDDLAHELVTTKLTLTKRVASLESANDALSKEVVQLRSGLKDTEDEKKRLTHESQQVKEMCRRELERVESENVRNTSIIADYKVICTQLSDRLEKQQTATRDELHRIRLTGINLWVATMMYREMERSSSSTTGTIVSPSSSSREKYNHPDENYPDPSGFIVFKMRVDACGACSQIFDSDGHLRLPSPDNDQSKVNPRIIELERQTRELELELAQTKLALVESECKTQDLTHQLNSTVSEINASKNSWFQKTLSQLKEVTSTKKEGKIISPDSTSQ